MDKTFAKKLFLEAVKTEEFAEKFGVDEISASILDEERIGVLECVDKGNSVFQSCVYYIDIPLIGIVTYDSLGKWADVNFFTSVGGVMLHDVE